MVESTDGTVLAVHWPKCFLLFKILGHLITVWTGMAFETEEKALRFN